MKKSKRIDNILSDNCNGAFLFRKYLHISWNHYEKHIYIEIYYYHDILCRQNFCWKFDTACCLEEDGTFCMFTVFIKASSSPIHIKFFLSLTFYRAKTNIITEIADVWSHSQINTHTHGIEKTQELSHGMNFDELKKKRKRENFQFSSYSWIKS